MTPVATIARTAVLAGLLALPGSALAADISTHVLDLARGVCGQGVPVVLAKQGADGSWTPVGRAATDANGRVRSFGDSARFTPGTYELTFDMARYPDAAATPFFPQIKLVFRVTDAKAHYHVPVVVSPFGYSTYRGN